MQNLGVAVLGTTVLGTAVLGTAVLHSPNRWIGKGTRPRLRLHGELRRTQSSDVRKPIRRSEPVAAQMPESGGADACKSSCRCGSVQLMHCSVFC
jgi:hypothetical protein